MLNHLWNVLDWMESFVPNALLSNMDKSTHANRQAIFGCKNEINSIFEWICQNARCDRQKDLRGQNTIGNSINKWIEQRQDKTMLCYPMHGIYFCLNENNPENTERKYVNEKKVEWRRTDKEKRDRGNKTKRDRNKWTIWSICQRSQWMYRIN